MFEDSTFESTGMIRTRSGGWMMATFALNGAILVALILIPLIDPEALPRMATSMLMEAPAPPVDEPKPRPELTRSVTAQARVPFYTTSPPVIPRPSASLDPSGAAASINTDGWNSAMISSSGSLDNPWKGQPHVVVAQQKPRAPTPVSSGVMDGKLIVKIAPSYPLLGREMHIEGTVILQATISRGGTIANLRVVRGPVLLEQAALDAVKQWRYQPYLLNGEPVEVETTVNVVFKLN
jgi:protein TonB